ncbi:importin-alpha export receptor [Orbilia oligospora]|nr:importin-alpha export receptor [Orbilia oligospora]
MSTSTYVPRHLIYNRPSPYEKGKWVPQQRGAVTPRVPVRRDYSQPERPRASPRSPNDAPRAPNHTESRPYIQPELPVPTSEDILNPKLKEDTKGKKSKKSKKSKKQLQNKPSKAKTTEPDPLSKSLPSFLSFFPRIFFCCISTRPSYTRIQHLIIPTSQVCVDTRALRFLQSLPRQEFLLLNYIVQEVFTEDGVKILGRISDYDTLIENALTGQIRTVKRPWTAGEREGYVEHTAGLYARLLRKLGTYEKSPMCEKVYGKKLEGRRRRVFWCWKLQQPNFSGPAQQPSSSSLAPEFIPLDFLLLNFNHDRWPSHHRRAKRHPLHHSLESSCAWLVTGFNNQSSFFYLARTFHHQQPSSKSFLPTLAAMDENMKQLAQLLANSLDHSQNKEAERQLKSVETTPGFPLMLLRAVATPELPINVRLAGALFFKNLIRRSWTDEEGNHKFAPSDVTAIKSELLGVMIQVPPNLQVQIGEAISVIADSDFYKKWETLVEELASKLDPNNPSVTIGVLNVAHSIFKRWRPLFRSDELFLEILHVLKRFGEPYLNLLKATDSLIESNKSDKAKLTELYKMLNLLIKIFFDLSCQDLPQIFEENLSQILQLFHKYLTTSNPLLATSDEEESGLEEYVKAGICEILVLYMQKYEDVFGPLTSDFASATWTLLTTTGLEPKYDILVSKALKFLTSVAGNQRHKDVFSNALDEVIQKIIIPNMTLRTSDEELFEDDPIEFIRRDLEGSDSDTRRRAANDFLRQLMEQSERIVTETTNKYIQEFLAKGDWKSRDTALYLFNSIAIKGVVTQYGVNSTNLLVDIIGFFQQYIVPDLSKSEVHPILRVDAIRFIYTFRSQFTKEQLNQIIPLLITHLGSSEYVVFTYAAITIERILYLQVDKKPVFTKEEIGPASGSLLTKLLGLITRDGRPEKIAENEFLMRCVMRILIISREDASSSAEVVLDNLIKITVEISKNPSNPRFNHYHFEALGALIRFVGPLDPTHFENALSTPFLGILQAEVAEFLPYVFQLLGLLLECNPGTPLPELYQRLIYPILAVTLWETRGNIPALVRLLNAICARESKYILENQKIVPIFGIFQKLLSVKSTEASAFDLLDGLVANFPTDALNPYVGQVFNLIMIRLTGSRTGVLTSRFTKFFYTLASRAENGMGPDWAINAVDSVQAKVFGELYKAFIIPETQKLTKFLDRKTAVVGLTKIVTSSRIANVGGDYSNMWLGSIDALLKLLEVPPTPAEGGSGYDQATEVDLDDVSFSVSFATLNTARKPITDPFPQIVDVRKWVGGEVKKSQAYQQRNSQLGPDVRAVLDGYA